MLAKRSAQGVSRLVSVIHRPSYYEEFREEEQALALKSLRDYLTPQKHMSVIVEWLDGLKVDIDKRIAERTIKESNEQLNELAVRPQWK